VLARLVDLVQRALDAEVTPVAVPDHDPAAPAPARRR